MKLTILSTGNSTVTVDDFDATTVMDLIEELRSGTSDSFVQLDLNEGATQSYLNVAHIVRIDVEV